MDKIAVSDHVLHQQICSECLNYLSVGPVLVTHEGQILCGRCSKNVLAADGTLNYSLYNVVAEKFIFKCVNHYEGCEELLFFNEAAEHEKNCHNNGLSCPFCAFQRNGCQLVQHFERDHPKEVVKENTFQITLADKFTRKSVIFVDRHIFCMEIFLSDSLIEIFNLLLTPSHSEDEHFTLKFFKSDSNIQFVTRPIRVTRDPDSFPSSTANSKKSVMCGKKSFVVDLGEIVDCFPSGWCLCKVEMTDRSNSEHLNYCNQIIKKIHPIAPNSMETSAFKEVDEEDVNFFAHALKLSGTDLQTFVNTQFPMLHKCGNCKKIVFKTQFYVCPEYHISCPKCITKKCRKCGIPCDWINDSKIHSLSLRCDYGGCHCIISIFEYLNHKRHCLFRKYKCPAIECGFSGSLHSLKSHWHLRLFQEKAVLKLSPLNQCFYWLDSNGELFYISTAFEDFSGKFSVSITELDIVRDNIYKFYLNFTKMGGMENRATELVQTTISDKSVCITTFVNKEKLRTEFVLIVFCKT